MRFFRKIILSIFVLTVLVIAAFYLFFPLDEFAKKHLEKTLGPSFSVEEVDVSWTAVTVKKPAFKSSSNKDIFRAKTLRISPRLLSLLNKELEIKKVEIDEPYIFLERDINGEWFAPMLPQKMPSVESPDGNGLPITISLKRLEVKKGVIDFVDRKTGFVIRLSEFVVSMNSPFSVISPNKSYLESSAVIARDRGSIKLSTDGNLFKKDFAGTLSVANLDITIFNPLIKGTKIKKGKVFVDSKFKVDKGYVRAPVAAKVQDIEIAEGTGTKGVFMGISTSLLKALIAKEGVIKLSFNVWGPFNRLETDIEDAFKEQMLKAIGEKITSPVSRLKEKAVDVGRKVMDFFRK